MNNTALTEEKIEELRKKVKGYLTDKRYAHTLAVEREAARLGEIFIPGEVVRLRAAALLHDITKNLDLEKQLQYCGEFGIIISNSDVNAPKILHAKTAPAIAKRDFPEFVDDDILSAVRWHTTGRDGMSIFEAIVYLADYIEETRTFEDCVILRDYFYDNIKRFSDRKLQVLRKTMIKSFDLTIKQLLSDGALIDRDTIEARNFYIFSDLAEEN